MPADYSEISGFHRRQAERHEALAEQARENFDFSQAEYQLQLAATHREALPKLKVKPHQSQATPVARSWPPQRRSSLWSSIFSLFRSRSKPAPPQTAAPLPQFAGEAFAAEATEEPFAPFQTVQIQPILVPVEVLTRPEALPLPSIAACVQHARHVCADGLAKVVPAKPRSLPARRKSAASTTIRRKEIAVHPPKH